MDADPNTIAMPDVLSGLWLFLILLGILFAMAGWEAWRDWRRKQ